MHMIKGTNIWRMISVTFAFIIFLGLYYFFKVYRQHTEQARLQLAEEMLSAFFWVDLSDRDRIYQAIFDQGLLLNSVNDEIYTKDLSTLSVLYFQNEDKNSSMY